MSGKAKKKTNIIKRILCFILSLILIIIICDVVSINWHSSPDKVQAYETTNKYITTTGLPSVSAHRSGGGIMPEESMLAFKNCVENQDFNVDDFEFDLHITKDNQLVLLHDDTLGRTTDCETVLGNADARPEDYTYDELRQLNIGAKFEDENGDMPYADISGDELTDDLRILKVDDILDYLTSKGDFNYIIEIKNDGDLGCKGVDILYQILKERNLLDNVIFGTFHEEVSFYVDDNYPDLKRSATINEVLEFYEAAIKDEDNFTAKYVALQVPYNMPWRIVANLGTTQVINYAHKHNIAVQYWTINSEKDLEYLTSIGADCIMSDYPDKLYNIIHSEE
jgi:glycerophosphoryl diester phosphodiesterase